MPFFGPGHTEVTQSSCTVKWLGCRLLRGRVSRSWLGSSYCFWWFSVIKWQLPFERSPFLPKVLIQKPEVQSHWCLKAKTHCKQPSHPPKTPWKDLRAWKGKRWAWGGGCLCNILLFPGTFILMSLLQLQTPQKKVCFIHFFNMMSWKEKKNWISPRFPL